MQMAWSSYVRLLHSHPLKTKALTSAFITSLSDVGLQLYEGRGQLRAATAGATTSAEPFRLNGARTGILSAVGLFYSGPVNHFWFSILERLVTTSNRWAAAGLKLVIDQTCFAPCVIAGYMTVRGALEGRSAASIAERLQDRWSDAVVACYQFWPAANMLAFAYVPVMYRVLYGNMCAIFWNARLSSISSASGAASDSVDEDEAPVDEKTGLTASTSLSLERIVFRGLEVVCRVVLPCGCSGVLDEVVLLQESWEECNHICKCCKR